MIKSLISVIQALLKPFAQEPAMDSRQDFLDTIREFYLDKVEDLVPPDLLDQVSECVTDYYFAQYKRFRKQYPKSIKRYSSFQVKDLDHPTTREVVIKAIREKEKDYEKYACIFLDVTNDELKQFEKDREAFDNK